MLGDPIRHLCELELESDLQQLPILADSIGDAGLNTVSTKSEKNIEQRTIDYS